MPATRRAQPRRPSARPAAAAATWFGREIERLYPGYFALVMATGIISNAFFFEGRRGIADALFAVNALAYPLLCMATLARIVRFGRALWADLIDPRLVFAALTLWFVLIYFAFGVLTFLNTAHGANVVHGGWLIAIVGTESLVILGSAIAPALGATGTAVFVLLHMLWGIGLGLYAIFIALFAHRIFFVEFEPDDITPLLWVVMGAAAISTNAGSTLILSQTGLPFLQSMRPFIDGVTLIMWAWATWWIPLLILFGVWKHGVLRLPITYTPMLWSLVFPLGMYALASLRLSLASDFPPLRAVSLAMVWIALAAWAATALGLAGATWRSWRGIKTT